VKAALRILQQPKKGIDEFVASPMSFLAAIGVDGVVIARDREVDRMRGQDFKTRFEVVRQALAGAAALRGRPPGSRWGRRHGPRGVLCQGPQRALVLVDPFRSAVGS
jgi:hypothetical protein